MEFCAESLTRNSACLEKRRQALSQPLEVSITAYIPQCTPEGAFVQVQCHTATGTQLHGNLVSNFGSACGVWGAYASQRIKTPVLLHHRLGWLTGYCWCVTSEGNPIPGTSRKGSDVTCRKSSAKECTPKNRKSFNRNLWETFNTEYSKVQSEEKASRFVCFARVFSYLDLPSII